MLSLCPHLCVLASYNFSHLFLTRISLIPIDSRLNRCTATHGKKGIKVLPIVNRGSHASCFKFLDEGPIRRRKT